MILAFISKVHEKQLRTMRRKSELQRRLRLQTGLHRLDLVQQTLESLQHCVSCETVYIRRLHDHLPDPIAQLPEKRAVRLDKGFELGGHVTHRRVSVKGIDDAVPEFVGNGEVDEDEMVERGEEALRIVKWFVGVFSGRIKLALEVNERRHPIQGIVRKKMLSCGVSM